MSDTTWTLLCVGIAVVVALISAFVAVTIRKSTVEKKIGSAEDKAREIIDEAIKLSLIHIYCPQIVYNKKCGFNSRIKGWRYY